MPAPQHNILHWKKAAAVLSAQPRTSAYWLSNAVCKTEFMLKVKVSFDGKVNKAWCLVELNEQPGPGKHHFVVKRQTRTITGEFITATELEYFISGVQFCRAAYKDGDFLKTVFISKV